MSVLENEVFKQISEYLMVIRSHDGGHQYHVMSFLQEKVMKVIRTQL